MCSLGVTCPSLWMIWAILKILKDVLVQVLRGRSDGATNLARRQRRRPGSEGNLKASQQAPAPVVRESERPGSGARDRVLRTGRATLEWRRSGRRAPSRPGFATALQVMVACSAGFGGPSDRTVDTVGVEAPSISYMEGASSMLQYPARSR